MTEKTIYRLLSLLLCALLMLGTVGCGKSKQDKKPKTDKIGASDSVDENIDSELDLTEEEESDEDEEEDDYEEWDEEEDDEEDEANTVSVRYTAEDYDAVWPKNTHILNSFMLLVPQHNTQLTTTALKVNWKACEYAESYTVILEKLNYDTEKFSEIEKKENVEDTSYTFKTRLEKNGIYRWNVKARNSKNSVTAMGGNNKKGNIVYAPVDTKAHPANVGMDFDFKNTISEKVLCNYLSRSLQYQQATTLTGEAADAAMSMFYTTGAKYIARSSAMWTPTANDIKVVSENGASFIKTAHETDPDIIFEACIFENITKAGVNGIEVPSWVFKAFGKNAEKRCFNYDDMLFKRGYGVNYWATDASIPDITREETQMFFYYLACNYIDAGYEGLHLGQVLLMGIDDEDYACYFKLAAMIREYAKKNARRGMILINAHTSGIVDKSGYLLCDFHAWPMRGTLPENATAHEATRLNPQEIVLKVGHSDSIYTKSKGGKTYSGWSCKSLPYFVEIDNYLSSFPLKDTVNDYWGYDEITWFANQPKTYRQSFSQYAYNWVNSTDSNGYFHLCGRRGCYEFKDGATSYTYYDAVSTLFDESGYDDEFAIRKIWINSNKNQ